MIVTGGAKYEVSRARPARALNHQEVDRVPIDLGGTQNSTMCAGAYENFKRFLGVETATRELSRVFETVIMDEAVLSRLPVDTRGVYARPPAVSQTRWLDDRTFVDEWGITFRRAADGVPYYDPIGHPLAEATLADLDRYQGPDVEDPSRYAGLADLARDLHENTDTAVCASTADTTIFDKAWMLRGMAQFLSDLLLDPEFALALLEKVADIQCRRQAAFLAEVGPYIDVTLVADDMGTQRGPIIRPDLYRKMIKPFHRRYIAVVRQHTGAKIHNHACGSIFDLVDDYIEIGIDALNPMQVAAAKMSPENLHRTLPRPDRVLGRHRFAAHLASRHARRGAPGRARHDRGHAQPGRRPRARLCPQRAGRRAAGKCVGDAG